MSNSTLSCSRTAPSKLAAPVVRRHIFEQLDQMPPYPPSSSAGKGAAGGQLVDLAENREQLRAALAERGIATGIHYPTPVPFQPAYAHLGYRPGDFPVAEELMAQRPLLAMVHKMLEYDAQARTIWRRFMRQFDHPTPS